MTEVPTIGDPFTVPPAIGIGLTTAGSNATCARARAGCMKVSAGFASSAPA
jgi:hypothetical protein